MNFETDPNRLFRNYFFWSQKMNSIFKKKILLGITRHEASRPKRRPPSLDPSEAIDCLFKLVRTGMQWRELQPTTASDGSSRVSFMMRMRPCFRSTFGRIHRNITSLTRRMSKMHSAVSVLDVIPSIGDGRRSRYPHSRIRTALCTTCGAIRRIRPISASSLRCCLPC